MNLFTRSGAARKTAPDPLSFSKRKAVGRKQKWKSFFDRINRIGQDSKVKINGLKIYPAKAQRNIEKAKGFATESTEGTEVLKMGL